MPVINGLTDLLHPCQVLADLLTVRQHLGTHEGKRIAWVGDGNNMANSWINAAYRLGFELTLACVLLWRFRERQRLTRFGVPLQHRHFPMYYGPLPSSPTARRRRSAPPDTH